MNTLDLFQSLSYGELSNLAMSEEGSGQIRVRDQGKVLLAANDGLINMYSRFILSTKNVWIEARKHITYYHLDSRFAESSLATSSQAYLYIKDLVGDAFEDDVIKILNVFDDNERQLPLNDAEHPMSVFTPQARILQIPNPPNGSLYDVVYQAKHVTLTTNTQQEIHLPDVLQSALRAYIAYKIYSNINTMEATAKASEHMGIYESVCQSVSSFDTVNTSISTTNVRFNMNSWV